MHFCEHTKTNKEVEVEVKEPKEIKNAYEEIIKHNFMTVL